MSALTTRPPAEKDIGEVVSLLCAAELDDSGVSEWTEEDLRLDWRELELDRNAWVVLEGGRIGGYASVRSGGDGIVEADGYVLPGLKGRGIGTEIVRLTEARAAELRAGAPVRLQNAVGHSNERALDLLRRHGYCPVRHFLRMAIDLERPPPAPAWPTGIAGRAFDLADARAVHSAVQEAFSEGWSFRPESFEAFSERRLENERFDPGLWFVASEGKEVAAAIICDWRRNDAGWIAAVAVRRPWRRRGLGLALLQAAFGEFYRRGERRCALGVDTQNPTGAARLYERAGMHAVWQADVLERELS